MPLQPQTPPWYDRLATLQDGYYYPWGSHLPKWYGEDAYLALVDERLRPDTDVLDVARGHGEVSVAIAPRCRRVLGYDRTAAWISVAQQSAAARGITNARFLCHDSSPAANGGTARIPAPDASFDLLICSKGPFHWLADARRVARPGAVIIMLIHNPAPELPWMSFLPEPLRWSDLEDGSPLWARDRIVNLLAPSGLAIDSFWTFVVPEIFPSPEEVYRWRTWGSTAGEVPPFGEMQPILERIFAKYGTPDGLPVPRGRFLWMAKVPVG